MNNIKKISFILLILILSFNLIKVNAEEVVATINEQEYTSLDDAIKNANDNDTITLSANATTEGINLNKNLTIQSKEGEHYTITFTKYGIAMWSKALTFKNVDVVMNDISSTPYTAEWNWMSICSNGNSTLTLDNSNMTMDGSNAFDKHAIYFTGNDILNIINNSNLTITNYKEDALEWDGGTGSYNVNIINSTYVSNHNRSGFTGTFNILIDNSKVDVINSTGNGSNGSNFDIKNNSNVNFINNTSHGLSAGYLLIDNSKVNANYNGANGIYVRSIFKVINNSNVSVIGNKCSISSKWTQPGAVRLGGESIVDLSSTFTVTDNNGSGIYLTSTATLDLQSGTITRNVADLLGIGGGIYNNGTLTISDGVTINNNKASIEADDIYTVTEIKLPEVIKDNLQEVREDGTVLNDCEDKINNWYVDSNDARWNAHGDNINVIKYENGTSIKAAHNLIGKVTVIYIDNEGKELSTSKEMTGYVGEEYTTEELTIDGYYLLKIDGNKNGIFEEDDTIVTYIYIKTAKGGDVDDNVEVLPPQTGITKANNNVLSLLSVIGMLIVSLFIKRS